jgi:hypothetical protein
VVADATLGRGSVSSIQLVITSSEAAIATRRVTTFFSFAASATVRFMCVPVNDSKTVISIRESTHTTLTRVICSPAAAAVVTGASSSRATRRAISSPRREEQSSTSRPTASVGGAGGMTPGPAALTQSAASATAGVMVPDRVRRVGEQF